MIAILLVYFIMVALYESVVYPFVVLFSIPVALVGALLALALTMESLTVFSIVGMIMLLGLVAKNAILIVDFANQLKAEGHDVVDALIEAGKERLRPILMTTLAMILGMLPIALASGAGAETKNGMAWVIIGGLTSSLLLTLLIVPSMYLVVDRIIARFTRKKSKTEKTAGDWKWRRPLINRSYVIKAEKEYPTSAPFLLLGLFSLFLLLNNQSCRTVLEPDTLDLNSGAHPDTVRCWRRWP
jgi:predicted RND superfamily exporter protein